MVITIHSYLLLLQTAAALAATLSAVHSVKAPLGQDRLRRSLRKKDMDNIPYDHDEPCYSIEDIEALQNRFRRFFDIDRDGKATHKEVANYLMKYDPAISKPAVDAFVASRDLNKNGVIDLIPDYLVAMSYPDSDPIRAREWFALEDANNDHIITKEDIEKIGARMGMSQDEIHDSMQYYALGDNNEDGKVTWEEYKILHGI
ncbi:unnamed protein product [Acanthosepion pharaonis]|uniref:Uncharacterized protein n=1 Tax=Acanthosepion pharaonis TaxID=158019 RepID=A0A812EIK8_ACAPH|nr:unnamed protein product [Sepia pharaonis]